MDALGRTYSKQFRRGKILRNDQRQFACTVCLCHCAEYVGTCVNPEINDSFLCHVHMFHVASTLVPYFLAGRDLLGVKKIPLVSCKLMPVTMRNNSFIRLGFEEPSSSASMLDP